MTRTTTPPNGAAGSATSRTWGWARTASRTTARTGTACQPGVFTSAGGTAISQLLAITEGCRLLLPPARCSGKVDRATREEQNHAAAHGRRHHLARRLRVGGGLARVMGDGRPRVLRLARARRRPLVRLPDGRRYLPPLRRVRRLRPGGHGRADRHGQDRVLLHVARAAHVGEHPSRLR